MGRGPQILGGPHGPSADTSEKRLAMEVEDHPVEYADFEGVIPEGNYGAGEVIVWDQGRWIPLGDLDEGMKKGKLLFELQGYKLRGKWTLVRMKKKGKADGKEWLLIKERDAWARKGAAAEYSQESIFSGLTLEDLASGQSRAAEVRAELERLKAPRRRLHASAVKLMLAEPRDAPFTKKGWLWELKYDGYRLLAERDAGEARLRLRNGGDATATFPEIARALRAMPFSSLVLDGELVVLDDKARPSFGRLQKRALLQRRLDIERASVELPTTLFRLRPARLRGLRPARPAAPDPQGPAPARPAAPRPRALRRPRRTAGRRTARASRRARAGGHRREEGGFHLPRRPVRGLDQSAAAAARQPRARRRADRLLPLAGSAPSTGRRRSA